MDDMIKLDKEEKIFIPLSKDYVIKTLFTNNKDVYKDFLISQIQNIINIDVNNTNINYNNVELGKTNYKEYNKILDLYIMLNNNIYIDFECNTSSFKHVKERNILYLNKISTKVLETDDNITKLKNIYLIQLNINSSKEEIFDTEEEVMLIGKKSNKIFSKLEYILIKNIEYYKLLFYNGIKLTKDKMWLVVLASSNYQELFTTLSYVVDNKTRNKLIKDVINMFSDGFSLEMWKLENQDNLNEIVRMSAYNDGIEHGIEQGIEKNTIATIKSMLDKNIPLRTISEITNKSIKEIKNIKNTI